MYRHNGHRGGGAWREGKGERFGLGEHEGTRVVTAMQKKVTYHLRREHLQLLVKACIHLCTQAYRSTVEWWRDKNGDGAHNMGEVVAREATGASCTS